MKHLLKLISAGIIFATLSWALSSCSPDTDNTPTVVGNTIFVPAEAGGAVEVKLTMEEDWQVRNSLVWLNVSPLSGIAGDVTLTVKTLESNDTIYEKEGYIDIIQGSNPSRYFIVQKGKAGIELIKDKMSVKADAGENRFRLNTNSEISATVDADWVTISRIEYNLDSTLLEDGTNYSAVRPAEIVFNVTENTSDKDKRNAVITVSCGEARIQVPVTQLKKINLIADWDKEFYKMSLGLRFTGSGCGYCPWMNEAFKNAVAERPDRMEIMNMHGYNSSDPLYYKDSGKFTKFYGVSGFPTGIFNSMVIIQNADPSVNTTRVVNLIDEAIKKYPAKSAISVTSDLSGEELSVTVSVATKEVKNYKLHIFLLENGYEGYQNGFTGTYQFDHFVRRAITDHFGDVLEDCGDRTIVQYEKTVTIPASSVFDYDKCYLLIFTTYDHDGKPEGTVRGVTYKDFGMIIDNVITCSLNDETQFRYEK